MRDKTNDFGFTVLEYCVVIFIVLFVALFALPNVRSSRLLANQNNAVSTLATLAAANALYFQKYRSYTAKLSYLYPDRFLVSPSFAQADLSNDQLEGYGGYYYAYQSWPPYQSFIIFAIPEEYGVSGIKSFVINETDEIFESDIHQDDELSIEQLKSNFVDYNFSIENRTSLWVIDPDTGLLILGDRQDQKWQRVKLKEKDKKKK